MEEKYVLSVGAGSEQLPTILIANDLGFKVISCDYNNNAIAKKHSFKFYNIDIKDEEKIIDLAKKYNIAFILPAPIGRYLTTIGAVNDALRLKGVSKKSANICTDKYLFNHTFKQKINIAKQFKVTSSTEVIEILSRSEINIPFILKPRFGSGSKGVQVFDSDDKNTLHNYFYNNDNEEILIEELMDGDEIGVDAVVRDGKLEILLLRDKTITPFPYRQEISYQTPSKHSVVKEKIFNTLNIIIQESQINNSLINADILIHNNQVYVIELSPRASGNNISTLICPIALNINPLEMFIDFLNNIYIDIPDKINPTYIEFFHFNNDIVGKIIEDVTFDLETITTLDTINCNLESGNRISTLKNGTDAFKNGYFVLSGDKSLFTKDRKKVYRGITFKRNS